MWWPHTQGCASLALGWRMLAFQAKETTATTAKNTAGTAVLLTGGTPVLRATTAKIAGPVHCSAGAVDAGTGVTQSTAELRDVCLRGAYAASPVLGLGLKAERGG
jgi:hypothetical protein